ncbi:MAG: Hsp20/alpha crystallin family protein [Spirochaetaceae bacterium]|jgi:HSP20 family molecular chaperone IbpA|nr:Hsp20/alpha crystallin family protein [Spirochaetaceae bacterium]
MQYNSGFGMDSFFEGVSRMAQDLQQTLKESGSAFNETERDVTETAQAHPCVNIYKLSDGALVFEFALAGFSEARIDLSFQGDQMALSASCETSPVPAGTGGESAENGVKIEEYIRRDFKIKPVENWKFRVPQDEFDQEKVKAVFKNGLLTVTAPPKNKPDGKKTVRIEAAPST